MSIEQPKQLKVKLYNATIGFDTSPLSTNSHRPSINPEYLKELEQLLNGLPLDENTLKQMMQNIEDVKARIENPENDFFKLNS